jgi:hypothetical protein
MFTVNYAKLIMYKAMFGLLAYPAEGIYKSVRSISHKGALDKIQHAKKNVMEHCQAVQRQIPPSQVVQMFANLTEK